MAKADLTAQRLREVLNYDPETGVFTWLVNASVQRPKGSVAGCNTRAGYIVIRIDDRLVGAHRLAWLYMHGELPNGLVDHIHGVRDDNRISQLRVVTNAINAQNTRAPRSNTTSGLLGVHWNRRDRAWGASITLNGKCFQLGNFSTREEAHAAYVERKRLIHPGCMI